MNYLAAALVVATAGGAAGEDFSGMRGANYVPSYARNDVQIWMDYDPVVIDRELGYAQRLKLNTVRVFLQAAVYERAPKLFLERFENFLGLCEKHHLRMMPVVFDSCFGEFPDLVNYRDKDWMANPGQNRLAREHWPKLEQYVRDVVGAHKDDRRIVIWDVMNEPTCTSFNKPDDKVLIWTFLRHFRDYPADRWRGHRRLSVGRLRPLGWPIRPQRVCRCLLLGGMLNVMKKGGPLCKCSDVNSSEARPPWLPHRVFPPPRFGERSTLDRIRTSGVPRIMWTFRSSSPA